MITDVFARRNKKGKADKLAVYTSKKDNIIWTKANWVYKPKASTFYFTKESLIHSIKMQLDSTYFVFGNKVFQQKEGIPMGTDDGPEIANLTLHQQEYEYMNKLQKQNVYKARHLNETSRLIDDITNCNAKSNKEQKRDVGEESDITEHKKHFQEISWKDVKIFVVKTSP